MKCITLFQPYATLVAIGAKKFETRSWPTKYRGPLAIHAAKRQLARLKALEWTLHFREALCPDGYNYLNPWADCGCVLAICNLTDCLPISPLFRGLPLLSAPDIAFGNFRVGRYAWKLENVRRLNTPMPARGGRRLWEWKP